MINGEGDSLRVIMQAEPIKLPQVEIAETEERHPFFDEYEKRRHRGIGTFITQKDLEKLNTSYTSDAFRRLPGMRFVNGTQGLGVRFVSNIGMGGSVRSGGVCQPTIWVDGQPAPGMEIDEIRAQDIHGIEIYRGAATTPPQFAKYGTAQCGTIVVWTRRKTK
jgi:outer membrane receptor for Fe3+-dicitrate